MASSVSQACNERPPAGAEGYSPKGTYETYEDMSCYVTGPKDAKKAIFFIYDIFGFKSQTIQGADILSSNGYLVFMPDFWQGKPAQVEWFARDTEEKKQAIADFQGHAREHAKHVERLHEVLRSIKGEFSSVEKWGAIGYCWGGKICTLTSGADTLWTVAIESSPSSGDPEDGKKISIPFASLLSKDESYDTYKAKHESIQGPKLLEVFSTQIHGWMSGRGKLDDPEVKKEYERGYAIALDWFEKHL